jgi:hypothetical protein
MKFIKQRNIDNPFVQARINSPHLPRAREASSCQTSLDQSLNNSSKTLCPLSSSFSPPETEIPSKSSPTLKILDPTASLPKTMATPIPTNLPAIERHITSHDAEGKAIFFNALPSEPTWQPIGDAANFFLAYTTRTFPVSLKEEGPEAAPHDIQNYEKDLKSPPGLSINQGRQIRIFMF